MKQKDLLIGAHMSIAGGVENAITAGQSINCTAIQIFTHSNRQWKVNPLKPESVTLFKQAWQQSTIGSIIAHAGYLLNLGSPQQSVREKSVNVLIEELKRCRELGIDHLVLHPGAYLDGNPNECFEYIAHNIDHALAQVSGNTMILLEIMAGQGTVVGATFEELALIRGLTTHKSRVGICLDTCHAFAAGYDFTTKKTYETMWDKFDKSIGIEHLKAMHFNDSKKERGSRVDRHEQIGKGKLGLEPFRLLLNDDRFVNIPKVLEIPHEHKNPLIDYAHGLEILRSLV
jgi:deoxyribonuclease IV